MTEEQKETRLATVYEGLRRREYELIQNLLEVLPKVDNLDEERVAQVRDALFHADHPFLMVFVGPFSSGKSTLINALLGQAELLRVGPVPTTDRISILRWGEDAQTLESGGEVDTVFYPSSLLKRVSFVDTPGLESVFQKHEETTRKFLHRSDVVLLVMLATQAMTSRNVEYLQTLREYGKKVIILINQTDLLTQDEATTVRNYVLEQSQARLGFKPEVWLVSARKGLAAFESGGKNQQLWRESGLNQIEEYIERQLDDAERMRQKLQTPLQILQNTNRAALDVVKSNQTALDHYQNINDNVQQQLTGYRRELEKMVRETIEAVSAQFGAVAMRGSEAIRDIFQLSRAVGSVWRGFTELIGLARLFRRGKGRAYSHTRLAFERHKVFEPVRELPEIVDRLGPRLEGKDMQDVDDLVKYAQKEIKALPPSIKAKVIGDIQAPVRYDRSALQDVRPALEIIETEAREAEVEKLDSSLRNALFGLALWEVLLLATLAIIMLSGAVDFSQAGSLALVMLLIGLILLGLLVMPLVGRLLETAHTNRMLTLQARYIDTLTKAADKQVEYGMGLRRDVAAPLTRLVEAQTHIQTEQLNRLQAAQAEMGRIEAELAKFGKKNLLGLRG